MTVVLPDGKAVFRKAPVIDLDSCIGYGISETRCLAVDGPAVCCTSMGEAR